MRKVIIGISILLLFFLSIYGWLVYRDSISYRHAIHQDANLIVKIDVDKIIKKGVLYLVTHPSGYFSARKSKEEKEIHRKGFSIPANIYLFSISNEPDILYTTLPVTDKNKLVDYLKQNFAFENFSLKDGMWSGYTQTKMYRVVISDELLLVSYSPEREIEEEKISMVMQSLLTQAPNENLLESLKNTKGEISALYKDLKINIDEDGKTIKVVGQTTSANFNPTDLPLVGKFLKNNWNRDLEMMFRRSTQTQLQIRGSVSRTDTITSYEFNEDFERIEKKEIRTYRVPGIALSLALDSLFKIQNIENLLNENGLVMKEGKNSIFHFINTDSIEATFSNSNYTFLLKADFDSFIPVFSSFQNLKVLNKIKSVELLVPKGNDKEFQFESTIVFKEDVLALLMNNSSW